MANHSKPSRNLKAVKERAVNTQGNVADNKDSSAVPKKAATVHESLRLVAANACELTGTRSTGAAARLLAQASSAVTLWRRNDEAARLVDGAAMMAEMAPQNTMEAMLAIQMVAIHEAGLRFLMYATQEGQDLEAANTSILLSTRLTRVFIEQLEAMQKLKGKTAQQKVTVEHVHVHKGGQAIVGAVNTSKPKTGEGKVGGGDEENNGNTP